MKKPQAQPASSLQDDAHTHDGKGVALFVLGIILALFGVIAMSIEFARGTHHYGMPMIIWMLAFLIKLAESFRLRHLLKQAQTPK
ncbi:hypothetical protein IQ22_02865 [Pseudomonas duriflava]|uniref:Uncharacterized protein n=1 Tax=Pseudomonas duriflava TaxID=459528 RepID=A0A562Q8I6_9PSED|nr:hypothetical protein [Pseudomonas duriflava]TWI53028.1 hypothetical protein IQ22_02865 [Pseudomonas duriflava]